MHLNTAAPRSSAADSKKLPPRLCLTTPTFFEHMLTAARLLRFRRAAVERHRSASQRHQTADGQHRSTTLAPQSAAPGTGCHAQNSPSLCSSGQGNSQAFRHASCERPSRQCHSGHARTRRETGSGPVSILSKKLLSTPCGHIACVKSSKWKPSGDYRTYARVFSGSCSPGG